MLSLPKHLNLPADHRSSILLVGAISRPQSRPLVKLGVTSMMSYRHPRCHAEPAEASQPPCGSPQQHPLGENPKKRRLGTHPHPFRQAQHRLVPDASRGPTRHTLGLLIGFFDKFQQFHTSHSERVGAIWGIAGNIFDTFLKVFASPSGFLTLENRLWRSLGDAISQAQVCEVGDSVPPAALGFICQTTQKPKA